MDASALASAESWLSVIAVAKLVAAFLVAAGVVIEFGGDWAAAPYERIVKEAREAQLATLSAEAETAKSDIAKANAAAAVANERAENARLEQERLKQIVKWRTIDATNVNALVAELVKGSGEIDLAYIPSDPESQFFALKIRGLSR